MITSSPAPTTANQPHVRLDTATNAAPVTTRHNAVLKAIGLPPTGHCSTAAPCTNQAAITVTPPTQHNTPARNATAPAAR